MWGGYPSGSCPEGVYSSSTECAECFCSGSNSRLHGHPATVTVNTEHTYSQALAIFKIPQKAVKRCNISACGIFVIPYLLLLLFLLLLNSGIRFQYSHCLAHSVTRKLSRRRINSPLHATCRGFRYEDYR